MCAPSGSLWWSSSGLWNRASSWDSSNRARVFRLTQTIGSVLYGSDQEIEHFLAIQAGRDRSKYLDANDSGRTKKFTARPECARIQRDGYARHLERRIEVADAGFVARRLSNQGSRAFRKNHHLLVLRQRDAGAADHGVQRTLAGATFDGNAAETRQSPSEEGDEHEFAFQYVDRAIENGEQRAGIPDGLMLHGEETAAFRYVLHAPHFVADTANHPVQGQPAARPKSSERGQGFRRNQ